ncbi:MAG: hypothetical protein AMQ74_01360 [Candidatus Methanofastidiosum methylothiophilum]|uniref:Uncharacterized protein n=1 Tax=Candidatus Methanofastidiosum methylothiophilum TaxID=1705564 RepID=A0A150IXW2_9EURY|nr:MAG: hypothetical protein AMQ74_01358 [Candidatus Methanofastidiosum methylthiophilus]KYC49838.1 MAG: hypothetical protein AMQ74_01360 [Candidatus Methanofastidiosum methylthiophilus]
MTNLFLNSYYFHQKTRREFYEMKKKQNLKAVTKIIIECFIISLLWFFIIFVKFIYLYQLKLRFI